VEAEHLPLHVQDLVSFKPQMGFMPSKARAIEQFEREALTSYLLKADGNVSRAAALAKIPRRSFHRLLAKHKVAHRSSRGARPK
jgi:transcriptional regulator of acetoin/glycerol metabolism